MTQQVTEHSGRIQLLCRPNDRLTKIVSVQNDEYASWKIFSIPLLGRIRVHQAIKN